MLERRNSVRVPCDHEGIILAGGCQRTPCRVADRSEGGVRLTLHSVLGIPDRFRVEMRATGEVLELEARWRGPGQIGARFVLSDPEVADTLRTLA
jgi:hypothetical protein